MTDRELMQQALEALEYWVTVPDHSVILDLRERLAQPEPAPGYCQHQYTIEEPLRTHWEGCEEVHPECKTRRTTREEKIVRPGVYEVPVEREPVAWVTGWHDGHCVIRSANPAAILPIGIALYTTPPRREWVGMTDEELHGVIRAGEYDSMEEFARAIKAKLKEKNA